MQPQPSVTLCIMTLSSQILIHFRLQDYKGDHKNAISPSATQLSQICFKFITRSSVVAAIADRTAYDVLYTGKLTNRFQLQVYKVQFSSSRRQ